MKFREFLKKHKVKLIIISIIIILIVAGVINIKNKVSKAMEEIASSVTTETVERQTISNYVSMTGKIVANDSQTVYSTQNGLKVLNVNVEVGDEVKAGDVIAILDSTDAVESLETAKRQLAVDEAKRNLGLKQAAENLQDARVDGLDNWKEGEISVDQANTDYYYAQIDVQRACEDLSKAKSDLAYAIEQKEEELDDARDVEKDAKKYAERMKKEYGEDSTEYASAKSAYNSAKDKRKDLEDELSEENRQHTFSSYYNSVASAERSVENANQSLERSSRSVQNANEKFADSAEDARRKILDQSEALQERQLDASVATDSMEDKVKQLQKQVDECTITAPISGVITSVSMEEGDETSNENNTICVIQDTSVFKVEGTVDEYDISKLSEGMSAIIKTEATGDLEMTGKVSFVSPTPKSGSDSASSASSSSSAAVYPVRITIDELDAAVRIGMTAEARAILETAEDVLTVPYDCIVEKEDGSFAIYVDDGKPESEDGEKASGKKPGKGKNKGEDVDPFAKPGREIIVKKGLETDYYVEISGEGIKEGMMVYVNSEDSSEEFGGFGGPGGGPGGPF